MGESSNPPQTPSASKVFRGAGPPVALGDCASGILRTCGWVLGLGTGLAG